MPLWAIKAWFWLRKNWKAVLIGVSTLGLGLLLGRAFKKRPEREVVNPELVGHSEELEKANETRDKVVEEAGEERDKQIEEVKKEHAGTVAKLTRKQRDEMEELQEDPDQLNSYLLNVGKDIRK